MLRAGPLDRATRWIETSEQRSARCLVVSGWVRPASRIYPGSDPAWIELLLLIADCDPTILSCSRLSFCRGRSRRSPRPKVAFSYSNCGAVSDFVDQLKGVVGSIPCWLFLGSCEEHDGEKVTGLVACTQTFSVLICKPTWQML